MIIKKIETFRLPEYPLSVFIRLTAEDGLVGYGESTNEPIVTENAIHNFIGPMLRGVDAMDIESLWQRAFARANYQGSAGAELRALSGVDIALWDMLGKRLNCPVYALFGGKVRDRIKIYNTCGNHGGRDIGIHDSRRFLEDAGSLAKDLLSEGITGMKIWQFDSFAAESQGQHITHAQVAKGLEPIQKIRDAVGYDMEIMLEGHSLWNLPSAIRIAKAVQPYGIRWFEDFISVDDVDNLRALRQAVDVPILASERLIGRVQYKPLLERGGADIVMVDISWTGGLTESRKIASMADAYRLPITTHNCGGPVMYKACAHFNIATINAVEMETVRAIYRCFPDITDDLPDIRDGFMHVCDAPGLGVSFKDEVFSRADIACRKTELS